MWERWTYVHREREETRKTRARWKAGWIFCMTQLFRYIIIDNRLIMGRIEAILCYIIQHKAQILESINTIRTVWAKLQKQQANLVAHQRLNFEYPP